MKQFTVDNQTQNIIGKSFTGETGNGRYDVVFFRFDADTNVRTFFSPKYVPLNNRDVIKQLYSIGFDKKSDACCTINDDFMSSSIFDNKSSFKINRYKMWAGYCFSNSETGLASFSLSAYVMRLVFR